MKFLNAFLGFVFFLCLSVGSAFAQSPENSENTVCELSERVNIDEQGDSLVSREEPTIEITQHFTEQFDRCLTVYPKEILYGDPVYLVWNDINVTDQIEPIKQYDFFDPASEISVSCDKIEPPTSLYEEDWSSCRLFPDLNDVFKEWTGGAPWHSENYWKSYRKRFVAGGQGCYQHSLALEFPPLEDWNKPFWRTVRGLMTADGVKCQVEIKYKGDIYNFDIVIKPRPAEEMDLLDRWFAETPSELLPCKEFDIPFGHKISCNGGYFSERYIECTPIELSNGSFPLCYFTRYGYRKPGDNNNPSRLTEWQELEKSLQPSTLRDEITFIVKELEYYNAEEGQPCKSALDSLVAWVRSQPEAQRLVFTDIVVDRFTNFFIDEKNRVLRDQFRQSEQNYSSFTNEDIRRRNNSFLANVEAYQNGATSTNGNASLNRVSFDGTEDDDNSIEKKSFDTKGLKLFLVNAFPPEQTANNFRQIGNYNKLLEEVKNDSEKTRRFSWRLRELAFQLDYMKVRDIEEPKIKEKFDKIYEEKFIERLKTEDPVRLQEYLKEYNRMPTKTTLDDVFTAADQ